MTPNKSVTSDGSTQENSMRARNGSPKNLVPTLVTTMVVLVRVIFILGLVIGNNLRGTGGMASDCSANK